MYSRAGEHPNEFAHLDHFRENAEIASAERLFVKRRDDELTPHMAIIHTINSEEHGELYGSVYDPSDQENFKMMLNSGLWLARHAKELMVNQLRIYRFLEGALTDIMSVNNEARFKVAHENKDPAWMLQTPRMPDPKEAKDDEEYERQTEDYRKERDSYLDVSVKIMPYTSMLHPMGGVVKAICSMRRDDYAYRLQVLKRRPDKFFECLFDIHEHSHYMLKDVNDKTNSWVSHCI